ncbi:MAG: methionyl-tRNA formyltransferase [Myxococcota bacterium]|nr:methionyl-tRNA formyltransferase [Myxococcota bacterium]
MPSRPRVVFLGTPEFAVPSLRSLSDVAEVGLVITQPDRQSGRGRKRISPPVKHAAAQLGIEVIQPDIVKGKRFAARIAAGAPDFIVTAAFGRLLGKSLLGVPKMACLNVHASLLPRHRGAAPANWAIIEGDVKTGVSIMQMTEGLDQGPVYHAIETPIHPEETAGDLLDRLAQLGARALVDVLMRFDGLRPNAQNHAHATWAPRLVKGDGIVDWHKDALAIHRHIRGMHPWPTAMTHLDGNPLKIHCARVASETPITAEPGTILNKSDTGIDVACGRGIVRLVEVQAAGRKRLAAGAFLAGTNVEIGTKLR